MSNTSPSLSASSVLALRADDDEEDDDEENEGEEEV